MKNSKAFTLIELLVGITLSTILMLGVGVFVTSGMKNILIQKSILENNLISSNLFEDLSNNFSDKSNIVSTTGTSVLIESNFSLDKGLFIYLGEKDFTGECLEDLNKSVKYFILDSFTPFEGKGGDFGSGIFYNNSGVLLEPFSSKISYNNSVFSGNYLFPVDGVFGSGNDLFVSDEKQNVIYKFDKTNTSAKGVVVVGDFVLGNDIGLTGTSSYLNHPTGLAFTNSTLFISDTGNDRILGFSGNKIYEILNRDDGLNKPMGLAFDSSGSLFISNSGNGEILKLNPKTNISPIFTFNPNLNFTANKLSLYFSGAGVSLSGSYSTGNFLFNFPKGSADFVSKTANELIYNFSGSKIFSSGSNYQVEINTFLADFSTGGVFVDGSFYNSGTFLYKKYFNLGNIGDDNILTKTDNYLELFSTGYIFPTGIYFSGNLVINDFIQREQKYLNSFGQITLTGKLNDYNIENISNFKKYLKIDSLEIKTNSGLLNTKIKYFKNYNCINENENIINTIIFKKIMN